MTGITAHIRTLFIPGGDFRRDEITVAPYLKKGMIGSRKDV